ncbi:PAS domain S-box protein, partial [candidate division KSB1 bacterium]|nr:PAS domain S-box protein [candidate division KSB1 bacterium]
KYRMLFKYSGTAVALVAPDGTFEMVNRQFEKLSGFVKEELESRKRFVDFFIADDRTHLESYLNGNGKIIGLQRTENIECAFIDRRSRKHDINLTLNRVLDSSHLLASIADVTEFRDLQKRLNRSENLAAIGELAASIGHEIRNPLGAINTSVEVLQNSLQVEGEDNDLMNIICEETKRLDLIITDFLQFARLNKSRFRKVDINRLIAETLLLFKEKMGAEIDREIDLCNKLPEIDGDANQLKQVLVNIIVNALEAMPEGGALTIRTRLESDESQADRVVISIRDSGEGISEEHLNKIFHPFYSTKECGVGMGLAICDRIVQNHGGEIAVSSKFEEGTEFTLILPVHNGTVT